MRYLFEDYALDTDRRELRRGHGLVPVEPQVFDLLAYLIHNRERVVSKDALLTAIWKGRTVSETVLTSRINSARCAIGDSGQQQRLIKTHLRKGVRFVGAVREEQQHTAEQPTPALALPDRPSIAVLPFTNMSVEQANSAAPLRPAEHAMIEAAIQLDLINPKQAEALVEKGKTLGDWLVEQKKVEMGEARESKQKMLDRLGLLALLLFNLVGLVGFGWIVLRVVRSL